MRGEYKNPNSIYITPELLEEIFLVLPLKSILIFKTVSKQWRSILESEMFVRRRRRMNVQKEPKLLAAYKCRCGDQPSLLPESRFEGDEEIVCLHCGDARPSMSCDGLVCIPEPESIIVLNPSTGQLRRFPPCPDPLSSRFRNGNHGIDDFGFCIDEISNIKIGNFSFRVGGVLSGKLGHGFR